jgi:hypothetical protein
MCFDNKCETLIINIVKKCFLYEELLVKSGSYMIFYCIDLTVKYYSLPGKILKQPMVITGDSPMLVEPV